jgi:DNA repair protein RAD16
MTLQANADDDDSDSVRKPHRSSARASKVASGNDVTVGPLPKPKTGFGIFGGEDDSDNGFLPEKRRRSTRKAGTREMSLNLPGKRKSGMLSDEDDDSDYDPTNIADYRFALRLQAEEDANLTKSPSLSFSAPTKAKAGRPAKKAKDAKRPGFVKASTLSAAVIPDSESVGRSELLDSDGNEHSDQTPDETDVTLSSSESNDSEIDRAIRIATRNRRGYQMKESMTSRNSKQKALEMHHPQLKAVWEHLKARKPLRPPPAPQPSSIKRQMKGFQLAGLSWMKAIEETDYKGGLLGDEMGLGKTIQAVSLIMSDYPARKPSLVLVPPVALMQWVNEIESYTDGTLKTFIFHGTNSQTKNIKLAELKKYDVILMSYQSLESMYRRETTGHRKRSKNLDSEVEVVTQKSVIHQIHFHRVILDEAHEIKTRTTSRSRACFALKADRRWCLSGTPLQNRIGELFSLVRFLEIKPFANYFCRACPCETLDWKMDDNKFCKECRSLWLNLACCDAICALTELLPSPRQASTPRRHTSPSSTRSS